MKSNPGLTLVLVDELLKSVDQTLDLAQRVPPNLVPVVLFAAVEGLATTAILCSREKKLIAKICSLSSKKRVNRALAIMRREGVIDQKTYATMKRVFRALRCLRNVCVHVLPPCREECPSIDLEEAASYVRMFREAVVNYVGRVGCRYVEVRT